MHVENYQAYTALQNAGCMLMSSSVEQELNIITTVYKCCVDHSVLMTSPLITAPVDETTVLLLLRWCEQSCGLVCTAAGAIFSYTEETHLALFSEPASGHSAISLSFLFSPCDLYSAFIYLCFHQDWRLQVPILLSPCVLFHWNSLSLKVHQKSFSLPEESSKLFD